MYQHSSSHSLEVQFKKKKNREGGEIETRIYMLLIVRLQMQHSSHVSSWHCPLKIGTTEGSVRLEFRFQDVRLGSCGGASFFQAEIFLWAVLNFAFLSLFRLYLLIIQLSN